MRGKNQYIADLRSRRDLYLQAEREILEAGQSMMLDDGITYTRAHIQWIQHEIKRLNRELARTTGANPMFQSIRMRGPYGGNHG